MIQKNKRRRAQAQPRTQNPSDIAANNNVASARELKTTWGKLEGYTIDAKGLTFKINASALSNMAFIVESDAPHYRSAVSTVMLALSQSKNGIDARVWVKYAGNLPQNSPKETDDESRFILKAFALGTGYENPFEILDWISSPQWI